MPLFLVKVRESATYYVDIEAADEAEARSLAEAGDYYVEGVPPGVEVLSIEEDSEFLPDESAADGGEGGTR